MRTAGDTVTLLGSWCGLIEPLDWDLLVSPTRSRGRSVRNLTVNVFHPFELLPRAWREHVFTWDPDGDEQREQEITSGGGLHACATGIAAAWAGFLVDAGAELAGPDPLVDSPRGQISYSNLLDQQRWHAAFHHRQLVDFLCSSGRRAEPLDMSGFAGLELPAALY